MITVPDGFGWALPAEAAAWVRTLADVAIEEALAITGGLLRRRIPAPPGLRRANEKLSDNPRVPRRFLDAAREFGEALLIDPQPLSGDPEYTLISLLFNRFDEIETRQGLLDRITTLTEIAELDAAKAHGWAVYRAVENWVDDVQPPDPAVHCEQIARWLL